MPGHQQGCLGGHALVNTPMIVYDLHSRRHIYCENRYSTLAATSSKVCCLIDSCSYVLFPACDHVLLEILLSSVYSGNELVSVRHRL